MRSTNDFKGTEQIIMNTMEEEEGINERIDRRVINNLDKCPTKVSDNERSTYRYMLNAL